MSRTAYIFPGIDIGSVVRIGDPCYTDDGYIQLPAEPGYWDASVEIEHGRVMALNAWHPNANPTKVEVEAKVSVDSGQMAIEDSTVKRGGEYGEPESYYGKCCAATLSDALFGIVDGKTVVSGTGYGDGEYPVTVGRRNGVVCSVSIRFDEVAEDDDEDESED